jgi:hypothetical protein
MIEHSYPECTTSVITALSIFRRHYPEYRAAEIQFVDQLYLVVCFTDAAAVGGLWTKRSGSYTRHKSPKVVGLVHGESASHTLHSLHWKACRWLGKHTKRVNLRARRASSSSASNAQTAAGEKATKYHDSSFAFGRA